MSADGEREQYGFIDLIKGIGIVLVVWGHTMMPRSVYIYSFHMPLFFFISGYLHRDKPPAEYFSGRFRRLLLPYMGLSAISWVFYLAILILRGKNTLIEAHTGKWISIVDGSARNGGNDSIWFLTALLMTGTLFWLLMRLRSRVWMGLGVLAATACGYALGAWNIALPFKLDVALTGLAFYAMGFETKRRDLLHHLDGLSMVRFCASAVVIEVLHVLTAFWNIRVSGLPKVAMFSNNLGNYFLFYISALSGIAVFTAVGYRLGKNRLLNALGISSMAILAFHKPILYLLRLALRGAVNPNGILYGIVVTVLTIVIILWIVPACRKYVPWLIGLRPASASASASSSRAASGKAGASPAHMRHKW